MLLKLTLASLLTLLTTTSTNAQDVPPGVIATGTMGVTNPPQATLGTAINQTSMARLLSVNSVDDFCLYAPPKPEVIGNSETYEVAWCTKPRNNARLIPDGTLTGVSFLKTSMYVQIMGYGDFTKLNIPYGDYGGELDPHGAYGDGNPIGGNVTSNITGTDQSYAEWMMYISYNQFCFRVCTNANSTYSAAAMCWHQLDVMGCGFVMPGNYQVNNTFETCDADVAYPPGWYPTATVSGSTVFSTFAQRYTGTLSNGSKYTVGDLTTPSAPYMTPKSSNCVTTSTISNGVPLVSLGVSGAASGASSSRGGSSAPAATGSSTGQSSAARKRVPSDGGFEIVLVTVWAALAWMGAVVLFA